MKTRGSRRGDALRTAGVERVAAQGCPHCAGREVVGWGRSDGLLRFRCKNCGRTFNALTKTPMAHLCTRRSGLIARAMRARPGQDRGALRRPSDDGLPLASPVCARPRPQQAANPACGCRSGRNLHSQFLKGRRASDPAAARLSKRGGTARHPGLHRDDISILVARDRKGATFNDLPQVDGVSVSLALAGVVTPGDHHRRRRQGDRHFRPPSRDSSPRPMPAPGKPSRSAAPAHQQRQRLSRPS